MTDILDLPGWIVTSKRLDGQEYELEAEYDVAPSSCQKCGVIGRLYRHGTKPTTYRDSPIRGHTTRILAKVQRYKCRDCGETFLQPLGGIQDARRMTERCVEYIQSQCLRDTFVRIAEHVGCDDKTVRDLAGDYIERLNAEYKPWLPEWLGIDETQIDGKLRCIITDVVNRLPIDMLPDRDKPLVTKWLYQFKDKRVVKGLAIDMWRPYKDAAQSVFPGLPVIIDKFHVVKMANKAMDDVRITLAKDQERRVGKDWMRRKSLLRMRYKNLNEKGRFNLQMWLDNEPNVAVAYHLKEAFYDIYEAPTKGDAAERLDEWRASVPSSMKSGKKSFAPLLTATRNWREEILAFFDHPISNGYTEALNGVAKVINRSGRGYSFEVLRARLLFKEKTLIEPEIAILNNRYQRNATVRRALLAGSDGRCKSCHGVFEPGDLYATAMSPVVAGEHFSNGALLCASCQKRFHTERSKRHGSGSTP